MERDDPTRIRDIATRWSLIRRAHAGEDTSATSARHALVDRYSGAAWRYLLAVTRDEQITEDLFQELALRVLRGDLRHAESSKGRFRDYLKTVLVNLARDYYRNRRDAELPPALADSLADNNVSAAVGDEREFIDCWRDELLQKTWTALDDVNARLAAVLRIHVENEDLSAAEKGRLVQELLDSPFSANRYRVTLHRARDKFAKLLADEVAATLDSPTEEALRQELRTLRLLKYCEPKT
ncbi:RNA polymerase sigma factor [Stieleria neptunia]|uniref:RNA polymerase sigma factor n=1 Tax=Stieleria neptunia TaxID=2527979 RepID=A0A518HVN8_9BACT|nr:sigma-70 family RNA polymerase sigma factor [Stieleria neptunia]QDV44920.1 RNA polymerase sigma factor [Stieleria neptunia]